MDHGEISEMLETIGKCVVFLAGIGGLGFVILLLTYLLK